MTHEHHRREHARELRAKLRPYLPYFIVAALVLWGILDLLLFHDRVRPGLQAIEDSGTLVIATVPGPTTYYEGREGPTGYEYELTKALAKDLGVKAEYRLFSSVPDVLLALKEGRAHIAAAGLTVTPAREALYAFSPSYQSVKEIVVCNRDGPRLKKLTDLAERELVVPAGTSYAERLAELREKSVAEKAEFITWRESNETTEALFAQIADDDIGCTVADTPIFKVNRRLYPELRAALDLTPQSKIAWAYAKEAVALGAYLEEWFEKKKKAGLIERLDHRFFDYFPEFDYVDISRFRRDIEEKLPDYRGDLEDAADDYGLPWHLLAAISYQESRWNPEARSPTGVRGFMMLTLATAEEVGVEDRLDPEESIEGGAKYFAELIERIPEDVKGTDRYWFALAAYNMGMGHLYDARLLAERRGLNKSSWTDLREVLPLLMDPKYYKSLRHGYARGREAQRYVSQVRSYLHILEGVI